MQHETATVGPDPATEKLGLWTVVTLIFVISWPSVLPQIVASWKGAAAVPGWMKLLQFLLVAPGLVAIAAAAANGGWPGAKSLLMRIVRWRASSALYAAVLLGPPAVVWLASWISSELGFMTRNVMNVSGIAAAFIPSFLMYFVLNTEELAWRGYVLPRMQARWSPLKASLILGVIWTFFHAPYFLMKGGHPGGVTPLLFVVMVMSLTVVMTHIFNASAGSVLLPHLFHQSVNAWVEAIPFLPRFAESRWPLIIAVGALSLIALTLLFRPDMRRKLSATVPQPAS
jgi:uncharacterized protein